MLIKRALSGGCPSASPDFVREAGARLRDADDPTLFSFPAHRQGWCSTMRLANRRPKRTGGQFKRLIPLASFAEDESVRDVSTPDSLGPGKSIGRFVILRLLGSRGVGAMYAARDAQLGRDVAVKLVRATDAASVGAWRVRVLREAQAMARLAHPNVVPVFEAGEHAAGVYIVMELVKGGTLAEWLHGVPTGPSTRTTHGIIDVFLQAGRGLAAAHAAGIVHRDFTPDNVLVGSDGRARVTDFGLARVGRLPETRMSQGIAVPVDPHLPQGAPRHACVYGARAIANRAERRARRCLRVLDRALRSSRRRAAGAGVAAARASSVASRQIPPSDTRRWSSWSRC